MEFSTNKQFRYGSGARSWAISCTLLFIVLSSGCAPSVEPELRVGVLVWPPYEIAYLAEQLGYFGDAPIELVEFRSPAELRNVYAGGGLDAVAMTAQYLVELRARDASHKAIMLIDSSDGGDAVLARPGIESPSDLNGHRIGVEHGALGMYMLRRALATGNLSDDDVTVVPIDLDELTAAYASGTVDAIVTYEPFRTEALKLGAHEIFSSKQIPNEIIDILITRSETIDSRADTLDVLVDGWLRAVEDFHARPRESAEILRRRSGLTVDEFLTAMKGARMASREDNRDLFGNNESKFANTMRQHAKVMAEIGLVRSSTVTDGKYSDSRFIEAEGS